MIFINYRRVDTGHVVAHLAERLKTAFGKQHVFYDSDDIQPGTKWPETLSKRVLECDVFVSVIGSKWLSAQNKNFRQLILLRGDWVRQEIVDALENKKTVLVVLVDDAPKLVKASLPKCLKPLADIQYQPLRHGTDWENDIKEIIDVLRAVSPPSQQADVTPYLTWVIDQCEWLDGRLLSNFVSRFPRAHLMVERRYIEIEVDVTLGHASYGKQEISKAIEAHSALGLLGEPGEGKTTAFRYTALQHARGALNGEMSVPVLLNAATIAERLPGDMEPALQDLLNIWDDEANRHGWHLSGAWLEQSLNAGVHVMIDDLDRVSDDLRMKFFKLIRECAMRYKQSKWCVVSRGFAWQEELVPSFKVARICELSDKAIEQFVRSWGRDFAAAFPTVGGDRSVDEALLRHIAASPALRDLARRPLFLTAICIIHWHGYIQEKNYATSAHQSSIGELPASRPALLRLIIESLLYPLQKQPDLFPGETRICVYGAIAFAMSMSMVTVCNDMDELSRFLTAELGSSKTLAPTAVRSFLIAESGHGLLREEKGTWRFLNRSFQDFLTAHHIVIRKKPWKDVIEKYFQEPEWSDTIAIFVALLVSEGRLTTVAEFIEMLLLIGTTSTLSGKAAAVGLVVHVFRDVLPSEYDLNTDKNFDRMAEEVGLLFDAKSAADIPVKERYEAVVALGVRGDLRLRNTKAEMVLIDGGAIWIGAQSESRSDANFDDKAGSMEGPVTLVCSGTFDIGKYPVTVHEYERFVSDGGYREQEYWSSKGREWKAVTNRSAPEGWDEQRRRPTCPVTRVSNFEAEAYCRWFTKKQDDGHCYRLPCEEEWEFAVRRDDAEYRAYVWGQEPKNLSNIFGFNQVVPIGFFLEDRSLSKLSDISCNVSEWTCDDWDSQRVPGHRLVHRPAFQRLELTCKTVKGGHYRHSLRGNRTSVRSAEQEQLSFSYVGFRVLRKHKPIRIKEELPQYEYAASLDDYFALYSNLSHRNIDTRLAVLNEISVGLGDKMEEFLKTHFPPESSSREVLPCRLEHFPAKFAFNLIYQDSRIKITSEKLHRLNALASKLTEGVEHRQRATACVLAYPHNGQQQLWKQLNDNDLDAIVFAILDHFEPSRKEHLTRLGVAANDAALAALPTLDALKQWGLKKVIEYQVFAGVRLLNNVERDFSKQFDKPIRFGPFMLNEFQQRLSKETQMMFLFDDNGELVWDLALVELLLVNYSDLTIVGVVSNDIIGNNASADTIDVCLANDRFSALHEHPRFVLHKENNPRSCIDPACASPEFQRLWQSVGCIFIKGVAAFETLQRLPKPGFYAFVVYSSDSQKCTGYERDVGVLFAAKPKLLCFEYGDPTRNLKKLNNDEE